MLFSFSLRSLSAIAVQYAVVAGSIAITGSQAGVNQQTGQRPFRQDYRDFNKTGPPFDLYIQALQSFQNSNFNDQQSYFKIAGT